VNLIRCLRGDGRATVGPTVRTSGYQVLRHPRERRVPEHMSSDATYRIRVPGSARAHGLTERLAHILIRPIVDVPCLASPPASLERTVCTP
jgi:hypothetical protein